jgi:hypothetical protein
MMTMRPDVAAGLNRIHHTLKRILIAALQCEDLPPPGVLLRVSALCFNDVRSDHKSNVVSGPCREAGNALEIV